VKSTVSRTPKRLKIKKKDKLPKAFGPPKKQKNKKKETKISV
jgi:hypothetical protein